MRKSDCYLVSVSISLEWVKMDMSCMSEPVAQEVEELHSLYPNVDRETKVLVHVESNLIETTNMLETIEQSGFDIGWQLTGAER
jgi:hypothetical protein